MEKEVVSEERVQNKKLEKSQNNEENQENIKEESLKTETKKNSKDNCCHGSGHKNCCGQGGEKKHSCESDEKNHACCCHNKENGNFDKNQNDSKNHCHCHEHNQSSGEHCHEHGGSNHSHGHSGHSHSHGHYHCCGHCHHSEREENPKIMIVRLIVSAIIFAFSFFNFLNGTAKLIISLIAFAVIGYDVIFDSFKGIFRGEFFDEKFLMLIASIGAFALGEYHEAVAVMLFYQLGEFLQDLAVDKSRNNIKKLLEIKPEFANIYKNGEVVKVNPSEIEVGDVIVVFAGEKVPLDGEIVEGKTSFNTGAITGESLPLEAGESVTVLSGFINLENMVKVKVTKSFENSTISKIIELVENSEDKKAKAENFITKFARIYTPTVVILAVILAIFPPLVFAQSFAVWIHRALLFLVVSCPCALVLSIPLSFFAGIGGASRDGILIKGANHIETLSKTDVVCFDKTGTLTSGNFNVTKVFAKNGNEKELLELCVLAEFGSTHPIAKSIIEFSKFSPNASDVKSQTTLAGLGVKADTTRGTIYVGNINLMESLNLKIEKSDIVGTVCYVAKDGEFLGYIVVSDEVKLSSKSAIEDLKVQGKTTCVLSGDKELVVENVSNQLGIDKYYFKLLPSEKAEIVSNFKKDSKVVAFVGDGINDAPVLKTADIGISMGKLGSDIAIESADVVIMDDNPKKVALAIKKSKKTMKIVKQNIVFTISFKVLMLLLSVFGLTSMWGAVFADVGVSILAVLNSLRAFKK